jgi:hypothetical protein
MGIKYGHAFWVDEDMSNVQQIECWGCAGMEVLDEQRKMKMRHKLQAERNAKCPLPGKWEDNPDKLILEMGMFCFFNKIYFGVNINAFRISFFSSNKLDSCSSIPTLK